MNYKYLESRFNFFFLITIFLLTSISCKKYLDAKPDKALVIPSTLDDLQALLDNNNRINNGNTPGLGDVACDDYWVSYADFSTRPDFYQKQHIWADVDSALPTNDWYYGPVFICNSILDELPKIVQQSNLTLQAKNIKGSALFLRGFSFYWFAQTYCKPYSMTEPNSSPGIPLRLTSNFNIPSTRGTVQQTYDQIISDFKEASNLLSVNSDYKTRPNKVAAIAALARTYLAIEDYKNAYLYADSALKLYSTLLDYNSLTASAAIPFQRFNEETIFYSYSIQTNLVSPPRANVDSLLYKSYSENDIRKTIFFQSNGNGNYGFKGSYASALGASFNGFATDELYLIRAECNARNGNKDAAMDDLNTLLIKRWKTGKFEMLSATSVEDALNQILKERRKELIMRGARWSDLRRLNKDSRFAKTLKRVINNGTTTTTYLLPPNDLRYVLLIPIDVIVLSGMSQNPR